MQTHYQVIVYPGDVDHSKTIELSDAILILKIAAGGVLNVECNTDADVNDDGRIGIEDAIFTLQKIAGFRL